MMYEELVPGLEGGAGCRIGPVPPRAARCEKKECRGRGDASLHWIQDQSGSRYRTTGIVPSAPRVWVVRPPSGVIPFFS